MTHRPERPYERPPEPQKSNTGLIAAEWSEVADVVVVTMIALSLPATLLKVGAGQQHVNDGQEAAGRLIGLLDEPDLPVARQPREPAGADVTIEDVTFGYAPD